MAEHLKSIYTIPNEILDPFPKKVVDHVTKIHSVGSPIKLVFLGNYPYDGPLKTMLHGLRKGFVCDTDELAVSEQDWKQFIDKHVTTHHALVFIGEPSRLNNLLDHFHPSVQKAPAMIWHSVQRPMRFDTLTNQIEKVE